MSEVPVQDAAPISERQKWLRGLHVGSWVTVWNGEDKVITEKIAGINEGVAFLEIVTASCYCFHGNGTRRTDARFGNNILDNAARSCYN